jgi:hypothetical protein
MTGDDHIDLSVLVVGYRSTPFLEASIGGTLRAFGPNEAEVLFYDCSGDGSEDWVRLAFPSVRILPHRGNLGFGAGNNHLARHARGRFILLLNPDTVPRGDDLRRLLEFAKERPNCGIWGGRTVHPDGSPDYGSHQPMMTVGGLWLSALGMSRLRRGALPLDATVPQSVPIVSGAFLLITRNLWTQLQGFDEDYFMYAEEVDLCRRAALLGATPTADPSITLIHDERSGDPYNPQRRVLLLRGNATFLRKHRGPISCWIGRAALLTQELRRAAQHSIAGVSRESARHQKIAAQSFHAARRIREWWSGWPERGAVDRPTA